MTKIDLHMHTNCSDGALTPIELIDEVAKSGVKVFAIADHDTIDAYTDENIKYAEDKGLKLIKAVEISTKWTKAGMHVLGYNIDIKDKQFIEKLSKIRNARHDYLHDVGKSLEEYGYKLNIDELDKIEAVTKAHIARDIVGNKENEEKLILEFGHVPNMGEFIETIMNENCPCYVEKKTVTPKEAADLIRSAGGKVVLAHPVAYEFEDGLNEDDIEKVLNEMHADGVETKYIYVDRNNNVQNNIEKWEKFAKNRGYFTTIGSDFHLNNGIHPLIGFTNFDLEIPDDEMEEILKNLE